MIETADIIIAGTGFSGIGAAIDLRRAGFPSIVMLEKADSVGGTWRDNRYPGCACDIPSHLYSLSREPKSDWSRMYPPQPEIEAYLREVVRKHDLARLMRFGAKVVDAQWNAARSVWTVRCEDGRQFQGRFLVSAMGPLHIPAIPEIAGRDLFRGPQFHSAQWDHTATLAGKRVAVIGTGASAIQFVPQIVADAAQVDLYQRTPPWILPKPDFAFSPRALKMLRLPLMRRLFRAWIFTMQELRGLSFLGNQKMQAAAEHMARSYLARRIKDPVLRQKLTPDYRLGCKRVLISNDYYPALARDNVAVITDGIARITEDAIVTADGHTRPVDAIIYGTGFHTTDAYSAVRIVGEGGRDLNSAYAAGMHSYWGITVAGFPNLFLMLGPNSGLGHNSVVLMAEAQIRHMVSLMKQMRRHGWAAANVRADAETAWNDKVQTRLQTTVWNAGGCRSWYLDANGRNTTVWPGLVLEYQIRMLQANINDYRKVA